MACVASPTRAETCHLWQALPPVQRHVPSIYTKDLVKLPALGCLCRDRRLAPFVSAPLRSAPLPSPPLPAFVSLSLSLSLLLVLLLRLLPTATTWLLDR